VIPAELPAKVETPPFDEPRRAANLPSSIHYLLPVFSFGSSKTCFIYSI